MEGFMKVFIHEERKDSERHVLRRESLHIKINNREVYVDYHSTEDVLEDPLKAVWRFGSIGMKQVTKILKTKYQKVSTCLWLSQEAIFDLFILFYPWFWLGFKT